MTKATFRIPKGASFDLQTNRWFVAEPTEPRPFYESLLRTGSREFATVLGEGNSAYTWILPVNVPDGQSVAMERLTGPEYVALTGSFPTVPDDPDVVITGVGPAISAIFVSTNENKLVEGERGLVLPAGYLLDADADVIAGGGLDASELRSALLLWDRLDWPEFNVVKQTVNAETAFLESEGVLMRTRVSALGTMYSKSAALRLSNDAYNGHERDTPGRWSIGAGDSATSELDDGPDRSLLISLSKVVTIPTRDVPLEEVLEFRSTRRAELLALRSYVDVIYRRIATEQIDSPHALVHELDALQLAVKAQRRVATEAGWKHLFGNLGAKIQLSKLGPAAIAAYGTYEKTGSLWAGVGAGAGVVGVTASFTPSQKVGSAADLRYLISVERELGLR